MAAANAAKPRAAVLLPALERLEQRQVEAERLFKLQREATERLLAEQRVALSEHRRAWEQRLALGAAGRSCALPPLEAKTGKQEPKEWQDDMKIALHKLPRSNHARACPDLSDGDSDSSLSESSIVFSGRSRRGHEVWHNSNALRLTRTASINWVRPRGPCQDWLLKVSNSQLFQNFIGVLVTLNAVSFGIQVHQDVRSTLHVDLPDNWVDTAMPMAEHFFLCAFIFEVVLRLLAEQCEFLTGPNWKWNVFDAAVITMCTVDEIRNRQGGGSIASLRTVRLLRAVLRAVRFIRVFRFLRHLRLMLFSILSCMVSLFWALLFLALVMYMFALYLGEVILFYFQLGGVEVDLSNPMHECLVEHWDGIPESMRSLVFSISGGADWSTLSGPFWDFNVIHGMMYTLFILFTMFGLLNIMVGVFVQEAAGILNWDRELVLEDVLDQEQSRFSQLKDLFFELDQDMDDAITIEELTRGMEDQRIKAYFTHLNIDTATAPEFFSFLDSDGNGHVTMEEFISGCMRFQGSAKPLEVATLLIETKSLAEKVDELSNRLDMLTPRPSPMSSPSGQCRFVEFTPHRTPSPGPTHPLL